jgi:hypothetical protein
MLGAASAAVGVLVIIYLAVVGLFFVGWWQILSKAGYSGAWVFIALVPLVNIVMFFVFAFSDWPIRRELRQLRSSAQPPVYGGYGYPPVPPPPPR